jgi:hypothetical protein
VLNRQDQANARGRQKIVWGGNRRAYFIAITVGIISVMDIVKLSIRIAMRWRVDMLGLSLNGLRRIAARGMLLGDTARLGKLRCV